MNEKSLSDRILSYSLVASVVINLAWIAIVSRSDIFGAAASFTQLHEKKIKVFKPIPQKPKPKEVKPPPPPPKPPKIPPKIQPIKQIKPLPPRPAPPAPTRTVQVARSTRSSSPISLPAVPENTAPVAPVVPTYTPQPPTPVVPQPQPEPTPQPTPQPKPEPKPQPVVEVKPPPPPPPPPVVHPRNYSSISSQDPGVDGDYAQPEIPSDVDTSTVTNHSVSVSYEIDEDGHAKNVRVLKSSGNADVDDAIKEAIRRTHFKAAIQDHLKLKSPGEYTYNIG